MVGPTFVLVLLSASMLVSADDGNPFKLPPDEQIFKLREEERRAQQEAREQAMIASVAEKSTFSFRMQATCGNDVSVAVEKPTRTIG